MTYTVAFRALDGSHRWGTRIVADSKVEAVAEACQQIVRAWTGTPPDFAQIQVVASLEAVQESIS